MSLWDDPEATDDAGLHADEQGGLDRAPVCPACGVTALPGELAHVVDTTFVCDNAECDSYGEVIA
ncbi:hypothetical protein [Iamia sp.]|uniref:hypothetical protein n=1 Tax=Iamia sp. TaxID=2722710 RepID=UPI002D03F4C6|nr:hypothetical protein [Iamia sp.]HXH58366.1 hypothetical protein [Iamia sp.]